MSKSEIVLGVFNNRVDFLFENNLLTEGVNIDNLKLSIKAFVKEHIHSHPKKLLLGLVSKLESMNIGKSLKSKLFYVAVVSLISLQGNSPVIDLKFQHKYLDGFYRETYIKAMDEYSAKMQSKRDSASFKEFVDALKFKESSNDWTIYNSRGYMGLYQMGAMAIKDVMRTTKDNWLKNQLKGVNFRKFKNDPNVFPPEVQDKAFIELLRNNVNYLGDYLDRYDGKVIDGIEITRSGMIAAAHLGGHRGVKKFLKTNGEYNPSDGITRISDYMKKFAGYHIPL